MILFHSLPFLFQRRNFKYRTWSKWLYLAWLFNVKCYSLISGEGNFKWPCWFFLFSQNKNILGAKRHHFLHHGDKTASWSRLQSCSSLVCASRVVEISKKLQLNCSSYITLYNVLIRVLILHSVPVRVQYLGFSCLE